MAETPTAAVATPCGRRQGHRPTHPNTREATTTGKGTSSNSKHSSSSNSHSSRSSNSRGRLGELRHRLNQVQRQCLRDPSHPRHLRWVPDPQAPRSRCTSTAPPRQPRGPCPHRKQQRQQAATRAGPTRRAHRPRRARHRLTPRHPPRGPPHHHLREAPRNPTLQPEVLQIRPIRCTLELASRCTRGPSRHRRAKEGNLRLRRAKPGRTRSSPPFSGKLLTPSATRTS